MMAHSKPLSSNARLISVSKACPKSIGSCSRHEPTQEPRTGGHKFDWRSQWSTDHLVVVCNVSVTQFMKLSVRTKIKRWSYGVSVRTPDTTTTTSQRVVGGDGWFLTNQVRLAARWAAEADSWRSTINSQSEALKKGLIQSISTEKGPM